LYLRVYPPAVDSGLGLSIILKSVQLSIGPDPSVPAIEGSHANVLWHLAADKLEELAPEPRTYQCRLADLCRLNPDLEDEAIDVGQTVRLMSQNMAGSTSIDVLTRVTTINFDLLDPLNTQLTMETVDPKLTTSIANAQARKVFVNTVIALDDSGSVVDPTQVSAGDTVDTVSVVVPGTTTQPVAQVGSRRGTGDQNDDGETEPEIRRYTKGTQ
jgi:hypothetical protein